ncbi:RNA helicase [Elasticomyces elasticus]|uniref:RNA helicase n=1 Tax=Exophiala sideris TaxID=1016849 RepID=A0ABR0JQQ2_9EURO|nr:RNA helicase [Elasticomyces elasticus]KAK5039908.1 RNA helicase [Exophiala sideris]KAK5041460.1 RNA helicase [Exophiala sideris]KAK5068287.1 RNA helicase [Exophiala sideris]KAK5187588.1 RNA helicase [Eurotiomycetes sp. CCFEE 6388]
MLSTCILPVLHDSEPELSKDELLMNLKSGLTGASEYVSSDFDEKTQSARLAVTALLYDSVQALNATLKTYPPFGLDADIEDLIQSTSFKVLLAIGILYETLKEIYVSLFFLFETEDGLVSDDIEEASLISESLISILQPSIAKKGWCLARTSGLEKSLSAWYLLHLLPEPEDDIHSHCQLNQCSARYVTLPPTSVSFHTSQCDGKCAVLLVDNEVVSSMVEGGDFPVISGPRACSEVSLQVMQASGAKSWMAISHVWAHGLGNPHANAILQCRYDWLISQMQRTPSGGGSPIWVDTLCVPVGERYIEQRRMAINQMRRVYEDAAFVVVLHERLLSTSGAHVVTCQLEVLMSDWMQRIWTLQEGALPMPERVLVAFQDRLLTLEQLTACQYLHEYTRLNVEARLAMALSREFQFSDVVYRKSPEDKRRDANENRLMALVQAMSHRSTSKVRDEAIVFATLLGFQFGLRSQMPTMETIYSSLDTIPGEIIFRPGPRCSAPHLHSLPSSFLAQNQDRGIEFAGSIESERTRWAQLTKDGVVLKRPSLKLQRPQHVTSSMQIMVTCENHSLCLVPTSKTTHEPGSSLPVTDIMMNRSVYLTIPRLWYQDFDAVLVHLDRENDAQLDATYIGTAVMKRVIGEVAGVLSVVPAEFKDFVTWCLI